MFKKNEIVFGVFDFWILLLEMLDVLKLEIF